MNVMSTIDYYFKVFFVCGKLNWLIKNPVIYLDFPASAVLMHKKHNFVCYYNAYVERLTIPKYTPFTVASKALMLGFFASKHKWKIHKFVLLLFIQQVNSHSIRAVCVVFQLINVQE